MINVEVSKQSLSFNNEKKLSLKDAISLLEQNSLKQNEVVTAIIIEGERFSIDKLEAYMDYDIDDLGNPEIEVKSNYEIAFEALEDSNSYIDLINSKIEHIVKCYAANDTDEANIAFKDLIDLIDLFIQLISKVHKTVKAYNEDFFKNNDTIRNLEIHLLSILKALVPAREKNDLIMLSDLLEYELADNLSQWKIKAIPLMKKSKVD
ncbi:MAG: hypothetical protein CME69_06460 [Halobacteriovorax sp.]|nr:hypothetical protein [Halobacteriovorax sp.]MEE3079500.1 hypothetical protein [Bdellovibrionota bacterium]